jgi:hypothetical protein
VSDVCEASLARRTPAELGNTPRPRAGESTDSFHTVGRAAQAAWYERETCSRVEGDRQTNEAIPAWW